MGIKYQKIKGQLAVLVLVRVVLWIWLTGVFGIAAKYGEAVPSVKYRTVTASGEMAGGPMYVLERGLNCKWLGVIFAMFTAVTAFGIGNMVQANSISVLLDTSLGVPPWLSGLVMMILTALVILGGIRSIARVCEILVPFTAIAYVGGCLVLLALGWSTVPATSGVIVAETRQHLWDAPSAGDAND